MSNKQAAKLIFLCSGQWLTSYLLFLSWREEQIFQPLAYFTSTWPVAAANLQPCPQASLKLTNEEVILNNSFNLYQSVRTTILQEFIIMAGSSSFLVAWKLLPEIKNPPLNWFYIVVFARIKLKMIKQR